MPITPRPRPTSPTTSSASTTANASIQSWAICRPASTNGKWQHANLSSCPKLLDHSRSIWSICSVHLTHRLCLEHVTGLSQQAVVQDVVAKIVCDNLQALTALTAHHRADLRAVDHINQYPHSPETIAAGTSVRKEGRQAITKPALAHRKADLSSSRIPVEAT